jgi:plasmid stabilization system protein ParE
MRREKDLGGGVGARRPGDAVADAPDEAEEYAREYRKAFESLRTLAQSGVPVSALREVMRASFMVSTDAALARDYDQLRREIDAYLDSLESGDAAVQPGQPEDFAPSHVIAAKRRE